MPLPLFRKKHLIIAVLLAVPFAGAALLLTDDWSWQKLVSKVRGGTENVLLTDINGKVMHLQDFAVSRAIVVLETSTSCPMSTHYLPIIAQLEKEYRKKGVEFIFLNSIASDTMSDMHEAVSRNGIEGHYIHDSDGSLAVILGLKTTTDMIVMDSGMNILYRGAVDDRLGLEHVRDEPRNQYLRDALDSILNGQLVAVKQTDPSGCVLEVSEAHSVKSRGITYHNRIADIIQNNCVECHRSDGVGPFPLENYEDVAAHKGMIDYMVKRDRMPPWAPPTGNDIKWKQSRTLTAEEKADLLDWLRSDLAEGDKAQSSPRRVFDNDWKFGEPEVVLPSPSPVVIPATGEFPIVKQFIPNPFGEDRWIKSIEIKPTAPRVAHHIRIWAVQPGTKVFYKPGKSMLLGVYIPGTVGLLYPEGFAKRIPGDWDIAFEMHYTPNGTQQTDQTKLGLTFLKEPPKQEVRSYVLSKQDILIPAHTNDHMEGIVSPPVRHGTNVMMLLPHMHLRGKKVEVDVITSNGSRHPLLHVPRYDFRWQLSYMPETPIHIPVGSSLDFRGWYDNSARNPANPDPSATVHWGENTTDEMLMLIIDYYVNGK